MPTPLPIYRYACRCSLAAYTFLLALLSWLAAPAAFAQLTSPTLATVQTDKPDYLPGYVVVIEDDGWQANEAMTLVIDHSTVSHGNTVLSAMADANGHIRNDQFVIQPIHFDEFFTLDATGQASASRRTSLRAAPLLFAGAAASG